MKDMNTTSSVPNIPVELQAQAQDWLLRLQTGPVTAADAEAFRRWRARDPLHAVAFAQVRRLWVALAPAMQTAVAPVIAPSPTPVGAAGTVALPPSGRRRPRHAVNLRRRAFLGGVAAASAGWMVVRSPLGMWPELSALAADYRTATGELRTLKIADVDVTMAARTTMNRPAGGSPGIEVSEGEAQFALQADAVQGFTIAVAGARLLPAPGARVNVRCVGTDVRITCLAGRAQLLRGARKVMLEASWQARLLEDRIASVAPVAADAIDAWRNGWLLFDDQPLQDVVDEINRYRTGRIVLAGGALPQRRVQARIPLERIDTFIDLVRDAYGAKVINMPGGVVLLS
ncbi:fec operon regulator FecR [compost metagenome]